MVSSCVFGLLFLGLLGGATAMPIGAEGSSCGVPAIYNFGDSNSDTGGISTAMYQINPPNGISFFGKFPGRACDGRLIIDLIAENLKLPYLNAYLDSAPTALYNEMLKLWKEHGFSSLIIAAPELDAWNLVKDLLPLLCNAAPFAIYHQYLQPLANCMHNLKLENMAINLQITEPWLREYQVLTSRSHPCMKMSAFGGYILTGTKICNS